MDTTSITPGYESATARLANVELTARAGDEEERKINIRNNNDGTVSLSR